jgi:hypothetical protein
MAKIKNAGGERYEKGGASRGAKAPNKGEVKGREGDESSSQIHEKHFGHVISTVKALHKNDPYKASHKL